MGTQFLVQVTACAWRHQAITWTNAGLQNKCQVDSNEQHWVKFESKCNYTKGQRYGITHTLAAWVHI